MRVEKKVSQVNRCSERDLHQNLDYLCCLTVRTIVSTSATKPDFLDWGVADSTGLVGAIVNPRHATIIAVGTLHAEIITKSSAATIDRGL